MTNIDLEEARRKKRYSGPVFFEYGFRPFFLGAGIQAVLAMAAWIAWIALQPAWPELPVTIAVPVHQWHAHEMIFGYALAAVAGFFLTAVPNWTGRQPVRGSALAVLFVLWLVARVASWSSAWIPPVLVALPELAFLAMLSALVGQALLSGWSKRNFVFLPVLGALFTGALLYHLDTAGWLDGALWPGHMLALDALLLLITVVGGRIVPAFTTNALRRGGDENLPRQMGRRDVVMIALVGAMAVADQVDPGGSVAGWIALAAGAAGAFRMIGWRTGAILHAPILWILHLGYGWLVFGLLLKGMALVAGWVPEIVALHALTVGAVGSMTLGVMTRAALGHTGRTLAVSRPIAVSYAMVSLAAVVRVAGPFLPDRIYDGAMLGSGLLWIAAFLIFAVGYWPVLTRPRLSVDPV